MRTSNPPPFSVVLDRLSDPAVFGISWTRYLALTFAGWILVMAAALGGTGAVVDGLLLLVHRYSARTIVGTVAADLALGVVCGAVLGPFFALFSAVTARVARRRTVNRWILVPVVAGVLFAFGWMLIAPVPFTKVRLRFAIVGVFALLLTFLLEAQRGGSSRRGRIFGLCVALTAIVVDVYQPSTAYPELHALLTAAAAAGMLVQLRDTRTHIHERSGWWQAAVLAVAGALSALILWQVDRLSPGWRAAAVYDARWNLRMTLVARRFADLDGDEFSPLFWGGDCDDLDYRVHPLRPGRADRPDNNCNGVVPPANPTLAQVGLTPEFGDPNAPANAIDLVLHITIDCMRADAIRPDVTPRLWQLARRGLYFTRNYAAGTRTKLSMPLMQRAREFSTPNAELLSAQGIDTTALIALHQPQIVAVARPGFQHVETPDFGRWDAAETTRRLRRILEQARGRKSYVWVHYMDLHGPYIPRPQITLDVPARSSNHATYLNNANYVDALVGQIVQELEADGRFARTALLVTADHGEGFGEHDIYFHVVSGYDMVTHVPGIFVAPGIPATVHHHITSHRDIPPTVLGSFGLLGTPERREVMGRSWWRLRVDDHDQPLHTFVVSRSARNHSGSVLVAPIMALVTDHWRFVDAFEPGEQLLFDEVGDPSESVNLVPSMPDRAESLRRQLAMYRDIEGYPRYVTDEL